MENTTKWFNKSLRIRSPARQTALRTFLLAALYFSVGKISISLSASSGIVTLVIFVAEGLALAATILWGRRIWPGIFFGQFSLGAFHGMALLPAAGIAVVNSLEAVIGATLFHRLRIHKRYDRMRDVGWLLVLIVFVLQPFSATFGNATLWLAGLVETRNFADSWLSWWFGNLVGQIVVTPLILSFYRPRAVMRDLLHKAWQPLLVILFMCLLIFRAPEFYGANISLALTPPLMVLLAARFGMTAATLGTALIVVLNIYYAHQGFRLFDNANSGSFVALNLFLLCLALVGQFVAALFAERQQAEKALEVSRSWLNEAQRIAGVGSWMRNLRTNRLEWSDEIYRIFEIDPQRTVASVKVFLDAFHPEDRAMTDKAYLDSMASHRPYQIIHRLLFPDGRIKYVQECCETLYASDGTPIESRGTVLDVTAIRRAEEKLHMYASALHQSCESIVITDSDNNIIDVNPAFTRLTGYSIEETRGKNPRFLSAGHTPPETYSAMWQALIENGMWQGELWDRRKDGTIYPKWMTVSAIRDTTGRVVNYIASYVDIGERKAAEERIHHLAHHDALTGLFNRFSLELRLEQALRASQREDKQMAVMFIDMDRFKSINDTLGHHIGDLLLIEVAARLQANARSSDIVARLGGDEFVVILTGGGDYMSTANVAAKIVEKLGQIYHLDGHDLNSSPSVGISLYPDHGKDTGTLIRNADVAMYHAKEEGRNRFKFFSSTMTSATSERLSMENDLREALAQNQFELHYQPQVNSADNRISRVEALARWRHSRHGMVPPLHFIPMIEKIGLSEAFGAWVLDQACHQLAIWRDHGINGVRMAVNISEGQLRSPKLVQTVKETLQRYCICENELELEVNESAAMDNPECTLTQMKALRALGVELAIGNFGAGFSSLALLKLLPIQTLKLSRNFVSDIESDPNAAGIIAAILTLARSIGIQVVAEGVETEKQRAFLTGHHCDLLQGYLVSHPLSSEEATRFIAMH